MTGPKFTLPEGHKFDLGLPSKEFVPLYRVNYPLPEHLQNKSSSFAATVSLAGQSLKDSERGLLVSPPMELDVARNKISAALTTIDPAELRAAVLFWDRLEWPTNSFMRMGGHPDEEWLVGQGVLSRSEVQLEGKFGGADAMMAANRRTLAELQRRDGAKWTMSRGPQSLTIIGENGPTEEGLLLVLHRAIPLPDADVPLASVLEYKSRRLPELLAMRAALDAAYEGVLRAPDRPAADILAMSGIDKAVNDLLLVSKENRFKQLLSDTSVSYNWTSAVRNAFVASSLTNFSMGGAALGALSGLSITTKLGSFGKAQSTKSPYEYVARAHRELPWTG